MPHRNLTRLVAEMDRLDWPRFVVGFDRDDPESWCDLWGWTGPTITQAGVLHAVTRSGVSVLVGPRHVYARDEPVRQVTAVPWQVNSHRSRDNPHAVHAADQVFDDAVGSVVGLIGDPVYVEQRQVGWDTDRYRLSVRLRIHPGFERGERAGGIALAAQWIPTQEDR